MNATDIKNVIRSNFKAGNFADLRLSDYRAVTIYFKINGTIQVVDFEANEPHCQRDAKSREFLPRQDETGSAYFSRVARYVEALA